MSRPAYIGLTLVAICAGFLSRSPILALPHDAAKYAGSVIWGSMVYFVVCTLLPSQSLGRRATVALVVAAITEFSQLIHTGWLDAFRRTTIGVLLIGRFFSWLDIASYAVGIAVASIIDLVLIKMNSKAKSPA